MKDEPRRVAGHDWRRWEDGWAAAVDDRTEVVVWPLDGEFHCKVYVGHSGKPGRAVCISLAPKPTRDLAMKHGAVWAESFLRKGPPGPDHLLGECFRRWKQQCRTRADALNHVFFSVTGGYEWLDGAVVSTSPEDHASRDTVAEDILPVGPVDDAGEPRPFSRVSDQFSLVCRVPDAARPEWASLAYEAACALAARSSAGPEGAVADREEVAAQEQNRRIGDRVRKDLERRFGLAVRSSDGRPPLGSVERQTLN